MSNHSGSYMLNSLLTMIERESFFSDIGPEKTAEFIEHVRGLPDWTPRSFTKGWNRFDYTFVDVRRLGSGAEQSHGLIAALASPETARRVTDLEALLQTAR